MSRGRILGGALVAVLVVSALLVGVRSLSRGAEPAPASSSGASLPPTALHEGLLYGRVTTGGGAVYEGRLRWGGDQEALWGDSFNGYRDENPWAAQVPTDELPTERSSVRILGRELAAFERPMNLRRPFMARFGDIERIERAGGEIRVTLKSGTVSVLDLGAADDLGGGLRVWDQTEGVVDLAERQIRTVELLPTPGLGAGPLPLHGTVHTSRSDFTGIVQWNRREGLATDELIGLTSDGARHLRFDSIRSIERRAPGSLVTLVDGSEIALSGTPDAGSGNRGMYVADERYGRVLISWDAFERVDFSPGGTGPAYDDFPPGQPLMGSVTTRSGRRLTGRLVFDLDESETTETLDAPSGGVNYMIPFSLIASVMPPAPGAQRVSLTLHDGEELELEPSGDVGEGNGGMLVFVEGRQRPEYVPWSDVERVELDGS